MSRQFPDDKTSLEWFCKTYNTLAIEGNDIAKKFSGQVNQVCETVLSLDPQSSMGQFTKALLAYESNNLTAAKDMLEDGKIFFEISAYILKFCLYYKILYCFFSF